MASISSQSMRRAWATSEAQEGVISHEQLTTLGFTESAIKHRLAKGRLHPSGFRGINTVGRRELSRRGRIMAAVLRCGPHAVASHETAAELWEFRPKRLRPIEISISARRDVRPPGIRVHRKWAFLAGEVTHLGRIPLTSPISTLLDLAARLPADELERAVNEADKRDLVDPEGLRFALDDYSGKAGVRRLRQLLDRHTFRLTDSELERRFLRIVRDAGLPPPETQARLNGHRVDFYWPDLGLVVETDGLRYHRTPAQQAKDRRRDQDHVAAGLTPLRFSHADVRYDPRRVAEVLVQVRP